MAETEGVDAMSGLADSTDIASDAATDAGLLREVNEDAVYAGRYLFAVADGFGSMGLGGEVASATVIDGCLADRSEQIPDLSKRRARVGDRYLLCTDGLLIKDAQSIHHVLSTIEDPNAAATELVALANAAGGPDNIGCVIVDVLRYGSATMSTPSGR